MHRKTLSVAAVALILLGHPQICSAGVAAGDEIFQIQGVTIYPPADDSGHGTVSTGYRIRDLGTLQNDTTVANDINRNGVVAGASFGYWHGEPVDSSYHYHPYRWEDGVMTDFGHDVPGSTGGYALGINKLGDLVGATVWAPPDSGPFNNRPCLWLYDGTTIEIGTLGGSITPRCEAKRINDNRQIIGVAATPSGDHHAFLWEAFVMTDLGTIDTGLESWGYDINRAGQSVGSAETYPGGPHHVIRWDGDVLTDVGLPDESWFPGGSLSAEGIALNDSGVVVGWASTMQDSLYPYLYQDSVWTNLGLGQFETVFPREINNHGVVVGEGYLGGVSSAIIWSATDGIQDLNDLLPEGSGWVLTGASAINDRGQIVGTGLLNGLPRAYLMQRPRIGP